VIVVLEVHPNDGADAGEGIEEGTDDGTVALANDGRGINGIKKHPGFLGGEYRRLAFLDDVTWATDGVCGIEGDHLTDDQVVKEHPDRGQVLLDRRRRAWMCLDVGRYGDGLDLVERQAALFAPIKELHDRSAIGRTGVFVSDPRDEELDKLPLGVLAGVVNDCR